MTAASINARFPEKLAFLFQPKRYKVLHGGRGGTKSWGAARALLLQGAQTPLRVLCCREYQNSIRDSVHKLLSDQVVELGLQNFYEVQSKTILGKNGTEFTFEGLHHNVNSIKSYEGADRVWVEEAQAVSKTSWNVLIPTIRKAGSEIWITMNPEFEDDETYVRFVENPPKSAAVQEVNWRDNPWFPAELEEERLDLLGRNKDDYDHVWEGKCRQWLEGAIYAAELRKVFEQGRICSVPPDAFAPVYTSWDLGRTDDTAIWWFQVIGGEIHVLECYASNGGSLSEYATQILGREVQIDLVGEDVVSRMGPPIEALAHRRTYRYARHWLPHDARAKTLAAKGKSIIEQLSTALTFPLMAIVPDIGVEDGIQAARTMFPRVWFDKEGTDAGIKALRRYQRKQNEDGRSYSPHPKHDWTSHYADAFRMMAVAWQHEAKPEAPPKAAIDQIDWKAFQQPEGQTLDAMWAEAAKQRPVARI